MFDKYYGLNLSEMHYALQFGLKINLQIKMGPFCAWIYIPKKDGVVKKLISPDFLICQFDLRWFCMPGDLMTCSQSMVETAGVIFIWHYDYQVLEIEFNLLKDYKFIVYDENNVDTKFIESESTNKSVFLRSSL